MSETYPFTRREIAIGGRTFTVETVDDQEALLATASDRAIFPFGLMLWEAAIALAEEFSGRGAQIAGKSMLELGAGLGLCGVVAAALGAHVTQTDHDPATLAACARTGHLNGVTGIRCQPGDWHAWRDDARYDFIIGADIAYDSDDHAAILALCQRNLGAGGTVLIADPGRENQALFLNRAATQGWRVRRSGRAVADLKLAVADAQINVTIIELTRA